MAVVWQGCADLEPEVKWSWNQVLPDRPHLETELNFAQEPTM
jgi:hypothetical protein